MKKQNKGWGVFDKDDKELLAERNGQARIFTRKYQAKRDSLGRRVGESVRPVTITWEVE
jgi:hypothetical protein